MDMTFAKRFLLLLALPLLPACSVDDDTPKAGTVAVEVQSMVGADDFQLYQSYTSPVGDQFEVSTFKYYISNVKLIASNGQATFVEPESYHLIAQDEKNSFELKGVPPGSYDKIEISIGVDEAHNHSTDQEGDLDPSNDMVWDWDTGYKFLSLVGTYTGDTRNGGLVFHVGGDTNYKTITLNLPQTINLNQKSTYSLKLQADVNELYQGPNLIDFDVMNTGGHGAGPSMIAENYSSGFLKVVEVN